jgi:hypothetical protein
VRHEATAGGPANPTECLQWGLNPQRDAFVELLCRDDDQTLLWLDGVGEQCGAVGPEVPVELGGTVSGVGGGGEVRVRVNGQRSNW